jgi:hypothetical protein
VTPLNAEKIARMRTWKLRRILSSRVVMKWVKGLAYAELLRRRRAHERS